MSSLPPSGRLGSHGLPPLLLMLRGAGFCGALHLHRDRVAKTVRFHAGDPVQAESPLAGESLLRVLQDRGRLSAEDAERAERMAAERGCKEEAALVGLQLLGPKDLVLALRDLTRRRILEVFGWSEGEFRLDPADAPPAGSEAFRVDGLALVRDGLAAHWTTERMLADLGDKLSRHPVRGADFDAAAQRLAGEATADRLLESLDEQAVAWSAVRSAGAPAGVATLWVLDAIDALTFRDALPETEDAESEEKPEVEAAPEIEIVIGGPRSGGDDAGGPRVRRRQKPAGKARRALELRKEVQEKHARFQEMDYYELLGVEPGAGFAEVKRAYLKAAKRFHPDALARLGLDDLKVQANEVFARIAKAHEVLSDPEQRAGYEATLSGHAEIDAERLAQAETLFRKGDILLKVGNFEGALEMLQGAVQLWPEDPAYQSALGWALYKNAPPDLEKARDALEKSISLEAGDAVSHQRLAIVLRDLGETEASKAEAATARKLDPNVRA